MAAKWAIDAMKALKVSEKSFFNCVMQTSEIKNGSLINIPSESEDDVELEIENECGNIYLSQTHD